MTSREVWKHTRAGSVSYFYLLALTSSGWHFNIEMANCGTCDTKKNGQLLCVVSGLQQSLAPEERQGAEHCMEWSWGRKLLWEKVPLPKVRLTLPWLPTVTIKLRALDSSHSPFNTAVITPLFAAPSCLWSALWSLSWRLQPLCLHSSTPGANSISSQRGWVPTCGMPAKRLATTGSFWAAGTRVVVGIVWTVTPGSSLCLGNCATVPSTQGTSWLTLEDENLQFSVH